MYPVEDNNILSRLTAAPIGVGRKTLPPVGSLKKGDRMSADVTIEDGTRVRLFYEVMEHKRHRNVHRWWGKPNPPRPISQQIFFACRPDWHS